MHLYSWGVWATLGSAFSKWDLSLTTELANLLIWSMPNITKAMFDKKYEGQSHEDQLYITYNAFYQWLKNQVWSYLSLLVSPANTQIEITGISQFGN